MPNPRTAPMKKVASITLVAFLCLAGCRSHSRPEKIVFGVDPLKQLSEPALQSLPDKEKNLLAIYVGSIAMSQRLDQFAIANGGNPPQPATPIITGLTVEQVLIDAAAWQIKYKVYKLPTGG